ncbi:MAG: glycine betaine ABC transporter substrate-binding protein [Blastocatellia bacterium]|nr:glycine betaine ABC transporter substrate-binding protein [Blastocatellia bacterium]
MISRRGLHRCCLALAILLACGGMESRAFQGDARRPVVRVGAKKFTEGAITGEVAARLVEDAGFEVVRRSNLVTNVLWNALLAGEIDIYPEYTGTLLQEVLAGRQLGTVDALRAHLETQGVRMSAPLGFDNNYALGMKRAVAERLAIRSVSDLTAHPALKLGFANEFLQRADGWPGLRQAYRLPHEKVIGLEHSLAYRALNDGAIDVTDLYTTDAEIEAFDLVALRDEREYFPRYQAVWLYRIELEKTAPAAIQALGRVEGRIDPAAMTRMNKRRSLDGVPESEVAAAFLEETLGLRTARRSPGLLERVARRTWEHLVLVALSLFAAILFAIPCGLLAARRPTIGRAILGVVGVAQTIPSLVLLVLMIPLFGVGAPPAIAALFLYSLLPIVQNTHAGLVGIPNDLRESAEALGLPRMTQLYRIELPMAARSILAGVKTSAVINVGTATLGGFIAAGGYGQPIFSGITNNDQGLMLEGALPAAGLAILLQFLFDLAERWVVPRGLRLSRP